MAFFVSYKIIHKSNKKNKLVLILNFNHLLFFNMTKYLKTSNDTKFIIYAFFFYFMYSGKTFIEIQWRFIGRIFVEYESSYKYFMYKYKMWIFKNEFF